jgi:hypothetical protein
MPEASQNHSEGLKIKFKCYFFIDMDGLLHDLIGWYHCALASEPILLPMTHKVEGLASREKNNQRDWTKINKTLH